MKFLNKRFKISVVIIILTAFSFIAFNVLDHTFEISKNLDIFATIYKELNANYVDDINPGEFMKTGIDAMLKTLDPYTVYIPESEIEDYKIATTGQYGGIGAAIFIRDSSVIISETYEGFPAQKGGLLAGDVIIEINGQSTKGKSVDDVSKILNGQQGTEIRIKVMRSAAPKILEKILVRENIKIDNIPYFGMVGDSKTN